MTGSPCRRPSCPRPSCASCARSSDAPLGSKKTVTRARSPRWWSVPHPRWAGMARRGVMNGCAGLSANGILTSGNERTSPATAEHQAVIDDAKVDQAGLVGLTARLGGPAAAADRAGNRRGATCPHAASARTGVGCFGAASLPPPSFGDRDRSSSPPGVAGRPEPAL